jgi:hypothetical protein
MLKLLSAVFLFACSQAIAGPQDASNIRITQNLDQSPSTGVTTRYLFVPGAGATCSLVLSGVTRLPHCYTLGAGLTVMNDTISVTPVQADWAAVSGAAQILNKPSFSTIAYTGDWADLLNKPATWAPSPHTHAWADIVSGKPTTLAGYGITDGVSAVTLANYATTASLSGYATTSALASGLAGKFNTPSGTAAQYVRGDGSLATLPAGVAPVLNFGALNVRTFAASTSYQATDSTKPATVKVSPSCTAALSLTAGGTCTIQVRIGTGTMTCATGTVVGTWTNVNTGTLTIGLGLNQTVGSPGSIELATGESFILCPTAGTFTLANGIDRALTLQ